MGRKEGHKIGWWPEVRFRGALDCGAEMQTNHTLGTSWYPVKGTTGKMKSEEYLK